MNLISCKFMDARSHSSGNKILDHSKASCRFAFHGSSKLPSNFFWLFLWGIDVENFFKWNQLTIHQSDGMWAEYVHLQAWIQQVDEITPSHRPGRWILCDTVRPDGGKSSPFEWGKCELFASHVSFMSQWKTVRKMMEKFRFPYIICFRGFSPPRLIMSPLWIWSCHSPSTN